MISATLGNEDTTAMYVDGVYLLIGPPVGGIFWFGNIERDRGAQGSAGIPVRTRCRRRLDQRHPARDPCHDSLGQRQRRLRQFRHGEQQGPSDDRAVGDCRREDIAFYASQQGQGWGRNLVTGDEVYRRDESSVRTKVLFTPSQDLKVTLASDYSQRQRRYRHSPSNRYWKHSCRAAAVRGGERVGN